MPKIITPAFPIEEVRGKLAAKQTLHYAENNNPAFDAPEGQRNYARDYKTCIVACRRAKDGKTYFNIKSKSATLVTSRTKLLMALIGASSALQSAILADAGRKNAIEGIIEYLKTHNSLDVNASVRKYMDSVIRPALQNKSADIRFAAGTGTTPVVIKNPWIGGGSGTDVTSLMKSALIFKFGGQLGPNGIVLVEMTFNGEKIQKYVLPGAQWGTAFAENGSMDTILGYTAKKGKEIIMARVLAGGDVQVRLGNGEYLSGLPLWLNDGEEETAVMPTDEIQTVYPYTSHAQA